MIQLDEDVEDALGDFSAQLELSRDDAINCILRMWLGDNRYLEGGEDAVSLVVNADEMYDDEEWEGPEALAKWRTRNIRDLGERSRAFHALWKELEEEQRLSRLSIEV